eukprot:TRINITY_DN620_c1_g1_i1.p1 TRINITY_DN620_c1_g1~~TRINITY_DN620_c1_g1_i1.p1  ORF type:complete len:380 (-),score=79.91 TRINITY_DN620_c1_g1_i1:78-1217(-)
MEPPQQNSPHIPPQNGESDRMAAATTATATTTNTTASTAAFAFKPYRPFTPEEREANRQMRTKESQHEHDELLKRNFGMLSLDELLDEYMYMIDFESSGKDGDNSYYAVEISVVLFTLREGELSYFHRFIYPDVPNYNLVASDHYRRIFHGIPSTPQHYFPDELFERDMNRLWRDFYSFVSSECPDQSRVSYHVLGNGVRGCKGRKPKSARSTQREKTLEEQGWAKLGTIEEEHEKEKEREKGVERKRIFPLFFAKGAGMENSCIHKMAKKAGFPLDEGEWKVYEFEDLIYEALARKGEKLGWSNAIYSNFKETVEVANQLKNENNCDYHLYLDRRNKCIGSDKEYHCALGDTKAFVKALCDKVKAVLGSGEAVSKSAV